MGRLGRIVQDHDPLTVVLTNEKAAGGRLPRQARGWRRQKVAYGRPVLTRVSFLPNADRPAKGLTLDR